MSFKGIAKTKGRVVYYHQVKPFMWIASSLRFATKAMSTFPRTVECPPRMVHDTVQFRVKALGTPRPSILWQKDDVRQQAENTFYYEIQISHFCQMTPINSNNDTRAGSYFRDGRNRDPGGK